MILQIKEDIQVSEFHLEKDIKFIQEKINFLEVSRSSLQMFFDVLGKVRSATQVTANIEKIKNACEG